MVTIVQKEDKTLRQIAKEVPISSITKPAIQKVIADMNQALNGEYDGAAIAAPQIGKSLRIFVVSHKVFEEDFEDSSLTHGGISLRKKSSNMVFINPKFLKISKDKKLMEEGCLSVRPLYGKVRRATKATVEAYNEHGKKFIMEGSGLLAHVFQHEIDHLEGVLFIDKAKDLREVFLNNGK
ncbi:MAG: peptide deformylase [Candidatus Moranbacteria bacterium]|nr:peptide deformylase [Candidatus Moranbacteria bacterium]